jgi:hypothetical protein
MRIILLASLAAFVAQPLVSGGDEPPVPRKADNTDPPNFVGPPAPLPEFKVVCVINTDENARPDLFGPAGLTFSPDGRLLAVADGRHYRFWNPRTGKELAQDNADAWKTREFGSEIIFVDRATVAVHAAADTHVRLLSVPSGKEVARLEIGEKKSLSCLAAAPGLVALGESGSGIKLFAEPKWERSWRVEIPNLNEDVDWPVHLAFSPDRTELVVSTGHSNVLVYRVADGKLLTTAGWRQLEVGRPKVAYHPNGRELAVASGNYALRVFHLSVSVWDTRLKARRFEAQWGADPAKKEKYEPEQAYWCLFTPDGKTVLVACRNGTLRLYESESGQLRHVGRLPCAPCRVALSPDGRLFVAADGANHKVSVIDWRATPAVESLDAKRLETLWADLASPDAARGFRAVVALGAAQSQAARLIAEKLKPVPVVETQAVKDWIADLGSEEFAKRETAEKELAKLGAAIEPVLRDAVKSDNPERSDRAGRLLKTIEGRGAGERLRYLRATEVLEYSGTPAAREALKTLASGAPTARLTQDAKAALVRLESLDSKPEPSR